MIIVSHPQGSDAWIAHRRTTRNASDAPAMMGASPYVTRAELIRQRATGVDREISAETQRVFDRGHAVEPALRALAERMIGEDLYPITATSDDGRLGASFDGVNLDETIIFEAKQSNAAKEAAVMDGQIPDADYWQIVHQFAVCTTAEVCYYRVGDGETGADMKIKRSDVAHDIPKLLAGWDQFDADVAAYVPEATKLAAVAAPVEGFGALSLRVEGRVLASNLDAFRAGAEAFLERLPKPADLQTDQDFADAKSAVKACGEAEDRIDSAIDAVLAQMTDVDAVLRTARELREAIRSARLNLDKRVKVREGEVKEGLVTAGADAVRVHYAQINSTVPREHALGTPVSLQSDIGASIKGLRTLSSMRDAIDAAVASAKIAASQHADRIRACIAVLAEHAEHAHLFADRVSLCASKAPDDLRAIAGQRVAEHERKEAARIEAERERIRAEEAARIEADRQAADRAQALLAEQEASKPAAGAPVAQQPLHESANNAGVATGSRKDSASESVTLGSLPPTSARIRLGEINALIAPLSITADGLAQLGIKSVGTERAAKLYAASDVDAILVALGNVINRARSQRVAA